MMPFDPREQYRIVKEQIINFQASLEHYQSVAINMSCTTVIRLGEVEYLGAGMIAFRDRDGRSVIIQNLNSLSMALCPDSAGREGSQDVRFVN